jgi:NTP pyrophosphatase (non-canonical NTP hydrolase)
MNIKPLKSEEDYQWALKELESIFHAELGTKDGEKAEILSILIEDYENKNYPIEKPLEIDYSFDYVYDLVKNACQLEKQVTIAEKGLKLTEEVGELAAELLKLTGYKYTNDTKEEALQKALLESVDTMIMIFGIMVQLGFTKQEIVEMTESQVNKWLKYVK